MCMMFCILPWTFYAELHAGAPEWVAHRGASYDAPENTLPAVRLAWEKGADAVEVDIHMTRDHQIVAIHDADTQRTAGKKLQVDAVDYADLKTLDVGSWKAARYQGTTIPLLRDVLAEVPEGKRIFIEIKCPQSVLPHLEKVVRQAGLAPEQTVFIAFDWETIRLTKLRFPECNCYGLSGFKRDKETQAWQPTPDQVIQKALKAGVDGVDVYHGGPVDADFVRAAKSHDLEVHVYTVNDPEDARRVMEAGVHGITTDRPAYLKEQLGLPNE